jgi:hypothetical protein
VAIIVGYNSLAAIEGVMVMDNKERFLETISSSLRLPYEVDTPFLPQCLPVHPDGMLQSNAIRLRADPP